MKESTRLIVALILIFVIAGSLILFLALPKIIGKTAILATRPIDPFDLLRGQYISINYEISSIPSIAGAENGDNIYVLLKEDKGNISRYESASFDVPEKQNFIKGVVKDNNGEQMRVEYGIEQYFFERNAYLPITDLTVEVKIGKSGQARIVQLLHLGKPVKIEYSNATLTS